MTREISHAMTAQDCLVALMVAISVSDETIRTSELVKIQSAVNNLPIFAEYDIDRLNTVSQIVFDLFEQEDHFGGHSYTYDIKGGDKITSVDLGFIVFIIPRCTILWDLRFSIWYFIDSKIFAFRFQRFPICRIWDFTES